MSLSTIMHHKCFHYFLSAQTYRALLTGMHTCKSPSRMSFVPWMWNANNVNNNNNYYMSVCEWLYADGNQRQRNPTDAVKRVSGARKTCRLGPQHVFRMFATFRRVHLRTVNASYWRFLGAAASLPVRVKEAAAKVDQAAVLHRV